MLGHDDCGAGGLLEVDLWASQVWGEVLSYEVEEDGAALEGGFGLVLEMWAHWVLLCAFVIRRLGRL